MTNNILHPGLDRPGQQPSSRPPISVGKPQQSAAQQGAALAFGKPVVKPKPIANNHKGNNEALAAATTSAKSGSSRQVPNALTIPSASDRTAAGLLGSTAQTYDAGQNTRNGRTSMSHLEAVQARRRQLTREPSFILSSPTGSRPGLPTKSPSYIAASLAAARSTQISSAVTGRFSTVNMNGMLGRNQISPASHKGPRAGQTCNDVLDTTSIPSTNSLIGLFEQNSSNSIPRQPRRNNPSKPANALVVESTSAVVLSPKPMRANPLSIVPLEVSPTRQSAPVRHRTSSPAVPKGVLNHQTKPSTNADSEDYFDLTPGSYQFSRSADIKPAPPLPSLPRNMSAQSTTSNQRYASRSRSSMGRFTQRDAFTIDQMANAIVASSLASSRAASPRHSFDSTRPMPTTRRSSIFHVHHHATGDNNNAKLHTKRSPSPPRGMRQTMRKAPNPSDEDEGSGRKRVKTRNPLNMKKHPNKHHEGDRKRWRDVLTERERKRYEALWASNKGILMTQDMIKPPTLGQADRLPAIPPQLSGSSSYSQDDHLNVVLNLVVRDIWTRSRLPPDVLSEVWDLVDRDGKGYLTKEEFVAGLWLIDQRLKGRKLPVRVSDSVWDSIGLGGLKVKGRSLGRKRGH